MFKPTHALIRRPPRSYVAYCTRQGQTVSATLADEQHSAYAEALREAGLSVCFVEPDENFPDGVFIEDTAMVWRGHALIARLAPHREGEQQAVAEALSATHAVQRIGGAARLDGGDVLHVDDTTYVGLSGRTNEAGAEAVQTFLARFGHRCVPISVAQCLHLKTGVTSLGPGTLLAAPGWFAMGQFNVAAVIHTKEDERGAANCLRIGDHLLIPAGYPRTKVRLQQVADEQGFSIKELDISEFEKGDGGLTCLSILWSIHS